MIRDASETPRDPASVTFRVLRVVSDRTLAQKLTPVLLFLFQSPCFTDNRSTKYVPRVDCARLT